MTTPTANPHALRKFKPGRSKALAISPNALDEEWEQVVSEAGQPLYTVSDGVAVVDVCGPLEHHESFFFESYDGLRAKFQAAADDDSVSSIVMRIDSPGGEAAGMIEAAKSIRGIAAAASKPLYAYADECACSAAYGLACAASEIWTAETGEVGSIGVILPVYDVTGANRKAGIVVELITTGDRKGDGHPDKPLDDGVRAALTERVNAIAVPFFRLVAKARGMSTGAVKALQAGVRTGPAAVEAGIADGVASWDQFMALVKSAVGDAPSAAPVKRSAPGGIDSAKKSGTRGMSQPGPKPLGRSASGAQSMSKILKLTKARDDARAAMSAAKPGPALTKAIAAYDTAVIALAAAQPEAAVKKSWKRTTTESEEDDGGSPEGEDEKGEDESEEDDADKDAEDDSDKKDAEESKDDEKCEDDGDDDEEKSSTDAAEQEKKNAKALHAKSGLYTADRLFRLAAQVTGKTDIEEVFGALSGIQARVKHVAKLETRVAKIEGEAKTARVAAMVNTAIKEGRATPAQRESLKTMGAVSTKSLAAFLEAQPPRVRTTDDGPLLAAINGEGAPSAKFDHLDAKTKKVIEMNARALGQSVEDATANFIATARAAQKVS